MKLEWLVIYWFIGAWGGKYTGRINIPNYLPIHLQSSVLPAMSLDF